MPWGREVGGGVFLGCCRVTPPSLPPSPPTSRLCSFRVPPPPYPSSSFPRSPAGAEGFVRSPTIFSAFGDHVGWKGIKGLRQPGGVRRGAECGGGHGGVRGPTCVHWGGGYGGLGGSLLFRRCCVKGTLGTLGMQSGGGTGCPQVSPDVPQQHVASCDSGCGYGGAMGCTARLGLWG